MLTPRQLFLNHIAQTSDIPLGIEAERAEGCYIYDIHGKTYLDLIAGISVSNLGHCHPEVVKAVKDQLDKSYIVNPADGTVLEKYTEQGEVEVAGKALYKIADLNNMYLRVYVSGTQLPAIKIGQKADVLIDKDDKHNIVLPGTVSWISSSAEFTPKIIQTKEERVNLVYAVKIRLKNDGSLKIGMPGEVNFIK